MLTPIEIQSKTFKGGLGYDRKDVDNFVAEVVESYESMFKQNQDLNRKVDTLTNVISQYKTIEKSLQKALLLAQKTSDDIKKQAHDSARLIEDDARNRANIIIADSKNELEHIHRKTLALIHQYELYKASFEQLARTQVQVLRSDSFNISVDELNKAKTSAETTLNSTLSEKAVAEEDHAEEEKTEDIDNDTIQESSISDDTSDTQESNVSGDTVDLSID